MKKIAPFLALSFIVGCSTPQPVATFDQKRPIYNPTLEEVKVSEQRIEAAKKALKKKLKDPYSAVIEEIYAVQVDGNKDSISYCGLVNAKNSYGGYTGIKPFRVTASQTVFLWDQRGEAFNRGITNYCPRLKK